MRAHPFGVALALLIGLASPAAFADEAKPAYNSNDYYEVTHDKRIYVFDDAKTFKDFLTNGETPFRLTRIGAGPHGETVVFGLRGMDKSKPESEIGAVNLYDGKIDGSSDSFYGEVAREGRIYVFQDAKGFKAFRNSGEAAYRYTDIGGGPKGETVVYVLSSSLKDKKPDDLIARFRELHAR